MSKPGPTPAVRIYDQVCALLRDGAGAHAPSELPWLGQGLVDAVSLSLASSLSVDLWLGPKARRGDVPRQVMLDGHCVALRTHPHGRLRAQLAQGSNDDCACGLGTIASLMRDRLHPDRYYLLSCGHVFGGSVDARIDDTISVQQNGLHIKATLVDWEPVLGENIPRTGIDAAIARIDAAAVPQLSGVPCAAGMSSTYRYDQRVVLKAANDCRGLLRTRWSGYVDVEGNDRERDYYLENAIGYQTEQPTSPGDSGAAVWDQSNYLLGIHVGAPIGNEQWRSNAVFCPIDRIMDWFDIEPVTSASGTMLTPLSARAARAPMPAIVAANSDDEISIVAKTLWGEARGEKSEGMRAVACVIGNRVERRWQGKTGYVAVCTAYRQFSCWNDNDPNRYRLDAVARKPDSQFDEAVAIAKLLLGHQLPDMTFGATHYFASSIKRRPTWAVGEQPCFQLGRHLFFNNIK